MYLLHVDDALADATVDSSEEVRGGQGDLALGQTVAGSHHQPRQGGVRVGPLPLPQVLLRPAVLSHCFPVRAGRADHHKEVGAGLLPAGQAQHGGGAGQTGPQGGGPALVSHGELLGGVGTPGGGQVSHQVVGVHQEAAGLSALALGLNPPHWVVAGATTGVTSFSFSSSTVVHGLDRDLTTEQIFNKIFLRK